MVSTEFTNGDNDLPDAKSVGNEPETVGTLQGQTWNLAPSRGEERNRTAAANKDLPLSTILGLVVSVFAIVGTVALFITPRFDDVNQSIGRLESKIVNLESRMTHFETSLTKLDGKIEAIGNMIIVAYHDGELAAAEIDAIWQQASE